MKKLILLTLSIFAISTFATNASKGNIELFSGNFIGSCVYKWNDGSVENFETEASSRYDAISNFLIIELSDRRQLVVFEKIDEPAVDESGATETHFCRRRMHSTILTEDALSTSRSTKTCLLPITIEFTEATAKLRDNNMLEISVKDELKKVNCSFSRN